MGVLAMRVRPEEWKPIGVAELEANAMTVVRSADNRSVIAGPGAGKTESTVTPLAGCEGVHEVSTISSEGALLSGTVAKDRADDATGGLLRQVGENGIVLIKDFTSILSLAPSVRPQVLGALRECYDGSRRSNNRLYHRELGAYRRFADRLDQRFSGT